MVLVRTSSQASTLDGPRFCVPSSTEQQENLAWRRQLTKMRLARPVVSGSSKLKARAPAAVHEFINSWKITGNSNGAKSSDCQFCCQAPLRCSRRDAQSAQHWCGGASNEQLRIQQFACGESLRTGIPRSAICRGRVSFAQECPGIQEHCRSCGRLLSRCRNH